MRLQGRNKRLTLGSSGVYLPHINQGEKQMKYLPVNIYRTDGTDCTNRGVTSEFARRTLVVPCPNGHISEDDVRIRGYVKLEVGTAGGATHFKPEGVKPGSNMHGGNFVYTSDSRFRRMYGHAPVAVHDRVEW
jgi:hypothetical protein